MRTTRSGNPYGFDHSNAAGACDQLQKLLGFQPEDKRFTEITLRVQYLAKRRLDVSKTGTQQPETLAEINRQLVSSFPLIFGPLAPDHDARLYYVTRCTMLFHRNHRAQWMNKKTIHDLDIDVATTPPRSLRQRMADHLAMTQVANQDIFGSCPSFPICVPESLSSTSISSNQPQSKKEVIVIDDSDDEDIEETPVPLPTMLPASPSSSNTSDIPSIYKFLKNYPSPPMEEFLFGFVEAGMMNVTQLKHIAGWTPEMRANLYRSVNKYHGGYSMTMVDRLALERAFIRYHQEEGSQ